MYAVVKIGSSQFKVSEGDTIQADLMDAEVGKSVTLDNVLLFAKDADIRIGQPTVKGVKVTAEVIRHEMAKKVIAFQYRRRKDSKRKVGHRAKLTALNITKITA